MSSALRRIETNREAREALCAVDPNLMHEVLDALAACEREDDELDAHIDSMDEDFFDRLDFASGGAREWDNAQMGGSQ